MNGILHALESLSGGLLPAPPGRSRRQERGFTLLELIVVITIIGILGTLVVVQVSSLPAKARTIKIKTDLKAIVHAAQLWQVSAGSVPQSLEEMKSGKAATTDGGEDPGISLEQTKDPWGNEYLYEVTPEGKPRARCLGKDQAEGGDGDNKDFEEPEGSGS